ncbi:MAG: hypothetical protein LBP54_08745 [Campylobacteraceae bacterium]|jgi:hypothetical protein|nr:hypothetical protein [Campylobacteraceae bacterium]
MTLHDFLEEKEFVKSVHEALFNILSLLLKKNMSFSVITNTARVGFNPPLPEDIIKLFQKASVFELCGYTLSTARIEEDALRFEAGFGENNFASLVSVPIGAILQIFIDNSPLFINMAIEKSPTLPAVQKQRNEQSSYERSLQALLNNPENKKLLKN